MSQQCSETSPQRNRPARVLSKSCPVPRPVPRRQRDSGRTSISTGHTKPSPMPRSPAWEPTARCCSTPAVPRISSSTSAAISPPITRHRHPLRPRVRRRRVRLRRRVRRRRHHRRRLRRRRQHRRRQQVRQRRHHRRRLRRLRRHHHLRAGPAVHRVAARQRRWRPGRSGPAVTACATASHGNATRGGVGCNGCTTPSRTISQCATSLPTTSPAGGCRE